MRWNRVCLEAIAYELPEERLSSSQVEDRLVPLYESHALGTGQLEALTGIRERRLWPPGTSMADAAGRAGKRALQRAGVSGQDLGAVVYAGVCRDNLEPATACAVAEMVGAPEESLVFDVSNACLGVLNGIVELANRIELGQMKAGLVVSAESSRAIIDATVKRMLDDPTLERFRLGLATMTGGSGAVGVVLTSTDYSDAGHRLVGGVALAAPEHHKLCKWRPSRGLLGETTNRMDTDASGVLVHGVALGKRTWQRFLQELGWHAEDVDKIICHQVGGAHRKTVLEAIGLSEERDFSTFETLGNIGTVSLPMTAAIAEEQGFLSEGDRVGFLGIGSGLNCLMLGVQW